MSETKKYSTDLWDYLGDMPYMPSRHDRDQLVQKKDFKRVQIWDYFFRIRSEDVGRPQRGEISEIENRLSKRISEYAETKNGGKKRINDLENSFFWQKIKFFLYGLGGYLLAFFIYRMFINSSILPWVVSTCIWPLVFLGSFLWISISLIEWIGRREIQKISRDLVRLDNEHELYVKSEKDRKNVLREMIKMLQKQIPERPDGIDVYSWVMEDFNGLRKRSQERTALGNDLLRIASGREDDGNGLMDNPIQILGPAELQHYQKIPEFVTSQKMNPDLNKHLYAKRSYKLDDGSINVVYGFYFLEHLLIAEDMLATYGLFFDFITGKYYAEQMTEQYFRDVVAIQITNEFRRINLDSEDRKNVAYVEEAPTFTLSLASGENRTMTFTSEDYLMEIREKIDIEKEDVAKIYGVNNTRKDIENMIRALRAQLRLHKHKKDD